LAIQFLRLNIFTSVFQKSMIDYARPVTDEGRFAIVTSVDAGCGGREDGERRTPVIADGEVVWS
jgi:hypothetical protein